VGDDVTEGGTVKEGTMDALLGDLAASPAGTPTEYIPDHVEGEPEAAERIRQEAWRIEDAGEQINERASDCDPEDPDYKRYEVLARRNAAYLDGLRFALSQLTGTKIDLVHYGPPLRR